MDEFEWRDTPPPDPSTLEAELRRLNDAPLTPEVYNRMIELLDDVGVPRTRQIMAELGVRAWS